MNQFSSKYLKELTFAFIKLTNSVFMVTNQAVTKHILYKGQSKYT